MSLTVKSFSFLLALTFSTFAWAGGNKSIEAICPGLKDESPSAAPSVLTANYTEIGSTSCRLHNEGRACSAKILQEQQAFCQRRAAALAARPAYIKGTLKCEALPPSLVATNDGRCLENSMDPSCQFEGKVLSKWKERNVYNKPTVVSTLEKKINVLSECKKAELSKNNDDKVLLLDSAQKVYIQQLQQARSEAATPQSSPNTSVNSTPKGFAGHVTEITSTDCDISVDASRKLVMTKRQLFSAETEPYNVETIATFLEMSRVLCGKLQVIMQGDAKAVQESFACEAGRMENASDYGRTQHATANATWKRVREPLTDKEVLNEKIEKIYACIHKESDDEKLLRLDDLRGVMEQLRTNMN
jgi:hypothetical protein